MRGKDPEIERCQVTSENCSSELIVKGVTQTLKYHFQDKIMFPFRFPGRHGISRQTDLMSLISYLSSLLMMGQDFQGNAMSEFKLSKRSHSTRLITKEVTISQGLLKGSLYRLWPLIHFFTRVSDV